MTDALSIALSVSVPLYIERFRGMAFEDRQRLLEDLGAAQLLAEKADVMQFGGGKKGEAANVFNVTGKAIALLAFQPGGIRIFGEHWEA